MLTGKNAEIYIKLWHLSEGMTPRVPVIYRADVLRGTFPRGETGLFFTHMDDREPGEPDQPGIWIKRTPAPSPQRKPDVEGADVRELITLAHERGHETSYRAGTYEPETMPEERRAWVFAEVLLRALGFEDWPDFKDAMKLSMDVHRHHGTPERNAR